MTTIEQLTIKDSDVIKGLQALQVNDAELIKTIQSLEVSDAYKKDFAVCKKASLTLSH